MTFFNTLLIFIFRLLESVSEATWRLQLVTDPDFISEVGTMNYACGQDPYHHFDGDWVYISHDLERSGLMKTKKKSVEKPSESGSHSNSSPYENSVDEIMAMKYKTPGPAIMNQMLACDSSLVIHCLAKGDVLNADHIIQVSFHQKFVIDFFNFSYNSTSSAVGLYSSLFPLSSVKTPGGFSAKNFSISFIVLSG